MTQKNEELKAPQIDRVLRWLHSGNGTFDSASLALLDILFHELNKITPTAKNSELHELWFQADRGTIDDFGNFDELLEDGDVERREEFENWWNTEYPDEKVWYHFAAVEHDGYRAIFIRHRIIIQINPNMEPGFPQNIEPLIQRLINEVRRCINALRLNTYNATVEKELPAQHRTGTIDRQTYWDMFPEQRKNYFEGITDAEIRTFLEIVKRQENDDSPSERIKDMTARMFYEYASYAYRANGYEGCDLLSPRELYYKHADGRDEGLGSIDMDSSKAYREWFNDRGNFRGHPWEVCRGGNSTHINLHVIADESGYYLAIKGISYGRSIEAIKFYLSLVRDGVPVILLNSRALAVRVEATDKIGIVPDGVMPYYCEGYFPDQEILDFINLPEENTDAVAQAAKWQPNEKVYLIK